MDMFSVYKRLQLQNNVFIRHLQMLQGRALKCFASLA